ncbi:MAG: ribonuclease Z [Clostridia bacterium]|nr:ribonuclease Z [Clostridia bacterium]
MITITLIGTAALVPLPNRALASTLLVCNGHSILFDCGEGTQSAARKAQVSLMRTDLIALTHYHGDHIFGLPGLLQTMCSMGRTEPLYITGPVGLREAMDPIIRLTGWTSYEICLIEFPPEGMHLASLVKGWPTLATLTAFPTEHRVSSQGYCFTLGRSGQFMPQKAKAKGVPTNLWGLLQKGQSVQVGDVTVLPEQVLGEARRGLKVVFSGDTAMCETLTTAAQGADLLITEATYSDNTEAQTAIERGHMTFAQAAQTAKDAEAKMLWLSHYSQAIVDPEQFKENATSIFPNTFCGADGMSVSLHFENEKKL